jgi:hypothetical protein
MPARPSDYAWFDIDTFQTPQTLDLDLAFSVPVEAVIVDGSFSIVAPITWQNGHPSGNLVTSFTGQVTVGAAPAYYLGVFDPNGTAGEAISVTSTY